MEQEPAGEKLFNIEEFRHSSVYQRALRVQKEKKGYYGSTLIIPFEKDFIALMETQNISVDELDDTYIDNTWVEYLEAQKTS